MKVGFTGTQVGMTFQQCMAFMRLMRELGPTEFHHGDCIGADALAAKMVLSNFPDCKVICHPPIYTNKQANVGGHEVLPRKSYLDRNRDIVDASEVMVATPKEKEEQVRSGTWYTVRYARRRKKAIRMVFPTGEAG
jgi:hypothetical protein